MNIGSGIQKLVGAVELHRYKQHGDRISLFYWFKNKEKKLKFTKFLIM
jgi:hypothetical protein